MHNDKLTVQCFGKFMVKVGSERIGFRTEKAEELLAYLIDNRGSFISRNKMIDILWEDYDGDRAITNYNTTLHYVKKAILPYEVQISILYEHGCYRLDTEGVDCDYLKFCAFLDSAGTTVNEDNILEYENAVALYSGEYLAGWAYDWAEAKRLLLVEQYIGLLLKIAGYYNSTGNYRKSVNWLETGLHHEPLHRELNYRLIEALQLLHERILATKYFNLYRSGLMKRLKLEPDGAFLKLLGQP